MGAGWGSRGLIADVGSWDGDNRHDVIERDGTTLYYHPGNGAGGFYSRVAISSGWDTINLVSGTGDMDRDGHTDFLARTTSGQLKVYRGDGRGKVVSTTSTSVRAGTPTALVLSPGDLTGDGKVDVLAVRSSDNAHAALPGHRHRQGRLPDRRSAGPGPATARSWPPATSPATVATTSWPAAPPTARSSSSRGNDMGALTQHSVVTGTATWAAWTHWTP